MAGAAAGVVAEDFVLRVCGEEVVEEGGPEFPVC